MYYFFFFKIYLSFAISILLFLILYIISLADGNIAYALFYFFIGGLFSIARYYPEKIFSSKIIKKYFFYFLGLVILIGILFSLKINFFYEKFFVHFFVMFLVYFFILLNKIFITHKKLWIFLGNLTYSSYLIHFPLQLLLIILFKIFEIELGIQSKSLFLFFIFTTIILSVFIYKNYEMPMQKKIRSKYLK